MEELTSAAKTIVALEPEDILLDNCIKKLLSSCQTAKRISLSFTLISKGRKRNVRGMIYQKEAYSTCAGRFQDSVEKNLLFQKTTLSSTTV